jgi:hypothetical protein
VPEGLELACVAEIFASGPSFERFGSGYVLPSGLVVTAAHVIANVGTPLPEKLRIELRSLADWDADSEWLKPTLVWPPPHEWSALSRIDIALLQLDPQHPSEAPAKPVRLDWEELPQVDDVPMVAVGFPRFKYDDRSRKRKTHRIQGDLTLADFYVDGTLTFENKGQQLPAHAPEARISENWKGISGSALFAKDTPNLVGVVTVAFDGTEPLFTATRLKAALKYPAFATLIEPARTGLRAPVPQARGPRVDPRSLLYRIDRDRQVVSFKGSFASRVPPVTIRPLCCVVVGGLQHEPLELAPRLCFEVARSSERQDAKLELRPFDWPRRADDLSAAMDYLRQFLWQYLATGNEPIPEEAEFRARINDRHGAPLLLRSELPNQLDGAQAALVAEWVNFWRRLGKAGLEAPIAHILIVPGATEEQVQTWLSGIARDDSVALVILPELEMCSWQNLLDWLDQCMVLESGILEARRHDLHVELNKSFNGTDFALGRLREELTKLLARGAPFEDLLHA